MVAKHLIPPFGHLTIDHITLPVVMAWIDELAASDLSPQTQRHALTWYQATRHTAVSRALKAGVPLDEVSAAVGHSSPDVTHEREAELLGLGSSEVRALDRRVRGAFSRGLPRRYPNRLNAKHVARVCSLARLKLADQVGHHLPATVRQLLRQPVPGQPFEPSDIRHHPVGGRGFAAMMRRPS
jgi:hypothetical protein